MFERVIREKLFSQAYIRLSSSYILVALYQSTNNFLATYNSSAGYQDGLIGKLQLYNLQEKLMDICDEQLSAADNLSLKAKRLK